MIHIINQRSKLEIVDTWEAISLSTHSPTKKPFVKPHSLWWDLTGDKEHVLLQNLPSRKLNLPTSKPLLLSTLSQSLPLRFSPLPMLLKRNRHRRRSSHRRFRFSISPSMARVDKLRRPPEDQRLLHQKHRRRHCLPRNERSEGRLSQLRSRPLRRP